MNRPCFALLLLLPLFGCNSDDDGGSERLWSVQQIVSGGTAPVANSNGDVVFLREGAGGGLYFLKDGVESRLNPDGEIVRSDYNFSRDGSEICVSAPGEPGSESAGIYTIPVAPVGPFSRWWDRGSSPCFSADGITIYCSGPDDGSPDEGIWSILRSSLERTRIAESGYQPKVSRDDHRIAYLVSSAGFPGGLLVALNRVTQWRDTLAIDVLDFDWADDSTLVYETLDGGVPSLWTIVVLPGTLPQRLANGTSPAGFPQGRDVVFVSIAGDLNDGLFVGSPGGSAVRIADTGSRPRPFADGRLVAQVEGGVSLFIR